MKYYSLKHPYLFTFIVSLALTSVAIYFSPLIDRDGMLYITLAQLAAQGDVDKMLGRFNWPFFPLLLAALDNCFPFFTPAQIAQSVSALFTAGTCTVMLSLLRRIAPQQAIGWAIFVVLCLPLINAHRTEVIRDWPAWFFMLAAIWAWFQYMDRPLWKWNLVFIVSLILATLARLDAAIIAFPLLALMLFSRSLTCGDKLHFFCLPLLAGLSGFAYLMLHQGGVSARLDHYLTIANPDRLLNRLDTSGDKLAHAVLPKFSWDYGKTILIIGLVSIIPIKLFKVLTALLIPYAISLYRRLSIHQKALTPFYWLAATWLLLMLIFMLQRYFLAGRYLVPLGLFLVPILYAGLVRLRQHSQSKTLWGLLILLIFAQGVASTISTRAMEKLPIKQAGLWAGKHLPSDNQVYFNDIRSAFYAGRPYLHHTFPNNKLPKTTSKWLVVTIEKKHLTAFLNQAKSRYTLVKRFDHRGKEVALILQRH